MLIVPLQPKPNQALVTSLGNQLCQINVYQKATGLFLDLYVDNALIIGGVICESFNLIVYSAYLGFIGDLAFMDIQGGDADPHYTGIGSRFRLAYLTPDDVKALNLPFPVGVS